MDTCRFRSVRGLLIVSLGAAICGCSGKPTPIEVPPIEPDSVATAIMAKYDKNTDGQLTKAEITGCPSLVDGMRKVDKDRDKKLSMEELVGRLAGWAQKGTAVSYFSCRVKQGGRPLVGAEITFLPEPFLADVLEQATGTTNKRGVAKMSMDKSKLPADFQNYPAVQQGYYRVEITHPTKKIPAKYNTDSKLGLEISFDGGRNTYTFKL